MGGSQSTRKLTIENEDPYNVIKVSNNVVERLKGNSEAVRKQSENASSSSYQGQHTSGGQGTQSSVPDQPNLYAPQFPPYMYEPSLTSMQVRQEKEAQMKKNDEHWKQRITDLQKNHEKINKIMEEEYLRAVTEVKSNFPEPKLSKKETICKDGKEAVMKCYKEHPKEPMRCAPVVQAFAECVDKHRSALVADR